MATTPNLNLYKPVGSDYVMRVRDLNDNLDKIDSAYGSSIRTGEIGIVVDGNTATLDIASGDYVIVKNTTIDNIDDGLYIAVNAVSAGNAIASADLSNTDTGNGGLNALKDKIHEVHTYSSGFVSASRVDKVCSISINGHSTVSTWGSSLLATLPADMRPTMLMRFAIAHDISGVSLFVTVATDGKVTLVTRDVAINTANYYNGGGTFVCAGD